MRESEVRLHFLLVSDQLFSETSIEYRLLSTTVIRAPKFQSFWSEVHTILLKLKPSTSIPFFLRLCDFKNGHGFIVPRTSLKFWYQMSFERKIFTASTYFSLAEWFHFSLSSVVNSSQGFQISSIFHTSTKHFYRKGYKNTLEVLRKLKTDFLLSSCLKRSKNRVPVEKLTVMIMVAVTRAEKLFFSENAPLKRLARSSGWYTPFPLLVALPANEMFQAATFLEQTDMWR